MIPAKLIGIKFNTTEDAATFLPSSINNLDLWLRASSITPSGGLVTTWTDESQNGYVWNASGGQRPTYVSSLSSANNHPAVLFNGTTNLIQAASAGALAYQRTQAITVFAAVRSNSAATTQPIIASGCPIITGWGMELGNGGSSAFLRFAVSNTNATNSLVCDVATVTLNTTRVYSVVYDGLSRVDGVQNFTAGTRIGNNATLDNLSASSLSSLNAIIGFDQVASFFAGHILEIIIYKRALETYERIQVETYLTNKYGVIS